MKNVKDAPTSTFNKEIKKEQPARPAPLQALVLITTPKLADQAEELLELEGHTLLYRFYAEGTASSEIMDMLGLGSIDKSALVSITTQSASTDLMVRLYSELHMYKANSGIAFTIPLNGVNNLILRALGQDVVHSAAAMHSGDNPPHRQETGVSDGHAHGDPVECRKPVRDDTFDRNYNEMRNENMSESKHSLIAAIVNRGFSGDVMDAVRSAGARGGTVIHSRQIENKEAASFWGAGMQEEKEIILILTESANKINLMKCISESCGMHSEAQGIVMSLPVDAVVGF